APQSLQTPLPAQPARQLLQPFFWTALLLYNANDNLPVREQAKGACCCCCAAAAVLPLLLPPVGVAFSCSFGSKKRLRLSVTKNGRAVTTLPLQENNRDRKRSAAGWECWQGGGGAEENYGRRGTALDVAAGSDGWFAVQQMAKKKA
ncbi:unnamed protein product, partial [Ectocarpus sp. 4 AP-2014]